MTSNGDSDGLEGELNLSRSSQLARIARLQERLDALGNAVADYRAGIERRTDQNWHLALEAASWNALMWSIGHEIAGIAAAHERRWDQTMEGVDVAS